MSSAVNWIDEDTLPGLEGLDIEDAAAQASVRARNGQALAALTGSQRFARRAPNLVAGWLRTGDVGRIDVDGSATSSTGSTMSSSPIWAASWSTVAMIGTMVGNRGVHSTLGT